MIKIWSFGLEDVLGGWKMTVLGEATKGQVSKLLN